MGGAGAVAPMDVCGIETCNSGAGIGVLIYDRKDMCQGYEKSAMQLQIQYNFINHNLNQLYCNVLFDNANSLGLFRSKGFTTVGVKREWVKTTSGWLDEYMLQLINPRKD